jgi:hypothetical protein
VRYHTIPAEPVRARENRGLRGRSAVSHQVGRGAARVAGGCPSATADSRCPSIDPSGRGGTSRGHRFAVHAGSPGRVCAHRSVAGPWAGLPGWSPPAAPEVTCRRWSSSVGREPAASCGALASTAASAVLPCGHQGMDPALVRPRSSRHDTAASSRSMARTRDAETVGAISADGGAAPHPASAAQRGRASDRSRLPPWSAVSLPAPPRGGDAPSQTEARGTSKGVTE